MTVRTAENRGGKGFKMQFFGEKTYAVNEDQHPLIFTFSLTFFAV